MDRSAGVVFDPHSPDQIDYHAFKDFIRRPSLRQKRLPHQLAPPDAGDDGGDGGRGGRGGDAAGHGDAMRAPPDPLETLSKMQSSLPRASLMDPNHFRRGPRRSFIDPDGYIAEAHFAAALKGLGFSALNAAEVACVFDAFNTHGEGRVEARALQRELVMCKLLAGCYLDVKQDMRALFRPYDVDSAGDLTHEQFSWALQKSCNLTMREAKGVIKVRSSALMYWRLLLECGTYRTSLVLCSGCDDTTAESQGGDHLSLILPNSPIFPLATTQQNLFPTRCVTALYSQHLSYCVPRGSRQWTFTS